MSDCSSIRFVRAIRYARSPRQRMPAGTVFLLASRGYSTEAGGAKFEGSNVIVTIGVGFAQM